MPVCLPRTAADEQLADGPAGPVARRPARARRPRPGARATSARATSDRQGEEGAAVVRGDLAGLDGRPDLEPSAIVIRGDLAGLDPRADLHPAHALHFPAHRQSSTVTQRAIISASLGARSSDLWPSGRPLGPGARGLTLRYDRLLSPPAM